MLQISSLANAPVTAAPPGAAPSRLPAVGFDMLLPELPGTVVSVLPRHDDAETGTDLPANAEGEDEPGVPTLWVVPPFWPAVCPPVDAAKGEARAGVPIAVAVTMPIVATPPAANVITDATLAASLPKPTVAATAIPATPPPPNPLTPIVAHTARLESAPAPTPPLAEPDLATSPKATAIEPARDVAADRAIPPAAIGPRAGELEPAPLPRVAPAAQMFAAALHQAARDERRPAGSDSATPLVASATDLVPHAVAATGSSPGPALDMARDTWPTKMIERIELLREAVDAADTRIRLVPDKLGTIDVALRRDGDTVAVQFTAHQPETRQLLADAQPRLAELADARGLRLSTQTGGTSDSAGGQQNPPPRCAAPASSIAPPHAPSHDADAVDDDRIA
jgi:hypothetical protein